MARTTPLKDYFDLVKNDPKLLADLKLTEAQVNFYEKYHKKDFTEDERKELNSLESTDQTAIVTKHFKENPKSKKEPKKNKKSGTTQTVAIKEEHTFKDLLFRLGDVRNTFNVHALVYTPEEITEFKIELDKLKNGLDAQVTKLKSYKLDAERQKVKKELEALQNKLTELGLDKDGNPIKKEEQPTTETETPNEVIDIVDGVKIDLSV